MSDFDRNVAARGFGATRAAAIDVGLRAYMIRIYNYMAAGVALTGIVSWLTYNAAAVTDATGQHHRPDASSDRRSTAAPLTIVLFLGTLGIVFFMSFRINRLQPSTALMLFMALCRLCSGSCCRRSSSPTRGASITRTFFISAASFGALEPLRLHHAARSFPDRLVPDHGTVRADPGDDRQHLPQEHRARLRHLGDRRADLCRA